MNYPLYSEEKALNMLVRVYNTRTEKTTIVLEEKSERQSTKIFRGVVAGWGEGRYTPCCNFCIDTQFGANKLRTNYCTLWDLDRERVVFISFSCHNRTGDKLSVLRKLSRSAECRMEEGVAYYLFYNFFGFYCLTRGLRLPKKEEKI